MEYEEFLEFVKGRRTLRAIKSDPIPDELVDKLLEAARWAPTGFNMQPLEMLVVKDLELRLGIKKIVDDYKNSDFFALEATREEWQGSPWAIETHGQWDCPLAPVAILVMGDTRRRVGLPMAARYSKQKGDSIFESSLSNAFMYMWLAAHSLGPRGAAGLRGQVSEGPGAGQAPAQPAGLHLRLRHLPGRVQRHGRRPVGQADAPPRRDGALRPGGRR